MSERPKRYRYRSCDLTADGIILTCDGHDQPLAHKLLLHPSRQQPLPCGRAKQIWYEEWDWILRVDTDIERDKLTRAARKQHRLLMSTSDPVDDKIVIAMMPFMSITGLFSRMSEPQLRLAITQGCNTVARELAIISSWHEGDRQCPLFEPAPNITLATYLDIGKLADQTLAQRHSSRLNYQHELGNMQYTNTWNRLKELESAGVTL